MQHSILSGSQHGEPTLKLYRTLARTSSLDAIVYCVAHHAQTGRLSWYISARSCFQWVQLDDGSHASSSAISGIARRHQEEIHGSHCRKKSRHEGCRENFGGDAATHKDILSLATGIKDFDDEGLSNHMMNFLAAGHETSSLAATWPCYLLCTHPKVQENLREEVRAHLPSPAAGSDAAPVTKVWKICNTLRPCRVQLFESFPLLRSCVVKHRKIRTSSDTISQQEHKSLIRHGP